MTPLHEVVFMAKTAKPVRDKALRPYTGDTQDLTEEEMRLVDSYVCACVAYVEQFLGDTHE